MPVKERLERLVASAARRPALAIGLTVMLAIAGAALSLGLQPSTGIDTFVSSSASSYQASATDHRLFGSDAIVILVHEPLTDLVETKDLATVSFLEACLAGQYLVPSQQLQSFAPAPRGAHAPYGGWGSPCGKLARNRPVQVVYGPGTFLNRAVAAVNLQINQVLSAARRQINSAGSAAYQLARGRGQSAPQANQAAAAARTLESQQVQTQLEQLYLDSGISGTPRIDDPQFIPEIVFDQTRGVNQPKARFSYLFPTKNAALIQVRLKSSLSDSQQAQAISWVRQAVNMPQFRSAYGGTYTVSGAPVVLNDLANSISGSIAGLLVAAILVMAVTLLIVFRTSLRLLPLGVALASAGITFGLLWLVGGTLTMASIAVLPVLIGLAVDYAIQFQSRVGEMRRAGSGPARSVAQAAAAGIGPIAVAALATATGFFVLLLSPVPMVRGFGLLLVLGIAVALVCALVTVAAATVLAGRQARRPEGVKGGSRRTGGLVATAGGAWEIVAPAARGAEELVDAAGRRLRRLFTAAGRWAGGRWRSAGRPPTALGPSAPGAGTATAADPAGARHAESPAAGILGFAVERYRAILAVGAVLALIGWIVDTQTSVQSDVTKLVPASMPALQDLHQLENVTGVSGEIDVLVHARNVATPQVVGWMLSLENRLQRHYGYLETRGCAAATLCPALSLPDLFSAGNQSGLTPTPSQPQINALLSSVPPYFSQAVISPDHSYATLAFGIRLMPLSKQQGVIDYMRSQLSPPSGVTAQLAGLPVLAAEANGSLASPGRRILTLIAGLAAVAIVLLLVLGTARRAFVPLIPIALATGWSALILFLIGIPLNPMSATLGTLVIAISTEFSVLLAERFRQERLAGNSVDAALRRTYQSTGRAALASGITAIAGFGVLVLSSITMLRDFGFVTLIDLSVSLAGVLIVLPAVLAAVEQEFFAGLISSARGMAVGLPPRVRRRAPAA